MGDWTAAFPAVAALDPIARVALHAARPLAAPSGACLFADGAPCQGYIFLLDGHVRVQKVGENGREITLYRLEPGETCILTTACLMTGLAYDAEAIAETAITARLLPTASFRELIGRSESFRNFVFKTYGTRLSNLMLLIEEVCFGRMDQRLAAFLLDHRRAEGVISLTHQEIASALGTAREVVSRQLKDFEHRQWLGLGRGQIRLMDHKALANVANKKTSVLGD